MDPHPLCQYFPFYYRLVELEDSAMPNRKFKLGVNGQLWKKNASSRLPNRNHFLWGFKSRKLAANLGGGENLVWQ